MLRRVAGGVVGFVVGFFAPALLAAAFTPSASYEVVIPYMLATVPTFTVAGAWLAGKRSRP